MVPAWAAPEKSASVRAVRMVRVMGCSRFLPRGSDVRAPDLGRNATPRHPVRARRVWSGLSQAPADPRQPSRRPTSSSATCAGLRPRASAWLRIRSIVAVSASSRARTQGSRSSIRSTSAATLMIPRHWPRNRAHRGCRAGAGGRRLPRLFELVVRPARHQGHPQHAGSCARSGSRRSRRAKRCRLSRRDRLGRDGLRASSASARATIAASVSATISRAPSRCSRSARCQPTWPIPCTATRHPESASEPRRCRAATRMARKMPRAVTGEGSPLAYAPPSRPATKRELARDDGHVGGRHPHVLGGPVAAPEHAPPRARTPPAARASCRAPDRPGSPPCRRPAADRRPRSCTSSPGSGAARPRIAAASLA